MHLVEGGFYERWEDICIVYIGRICIEFMPQTDTDISVFNIGVGSGSRSKPWYACFASGFRAVWINFKEGMDFGDFKGENVLN